MAWEISPWRPFEFERMRKEMDRLWDSFLEGRPSGEAISPDQYFLFGSRLHSLQNFFLVPRQNQVQRTRTNIKKGEKEEHDDRLHDNHNHRKDDKDEEAKRLSLGKIEFFKAEIPNF